MQVETREQNPQKSSSGSSQSLGFELSENEESCMFTRRSLQTGDTRRTVATCSRREARYSSRQTDWQTRSERAQIERRVGNTRARDIHNIESKATNEKQNSTTIDLRSAMASYNSTRCMRYSAPQLRAKKRNSAHTHTHRNQRLESGKGKRD
jgi:hypothetical protein